MPSKKKSKAPQGMSPQQAAAANRQGFNHAMNSLPPLGFNDMFNNFEMFTNSITEPFTNMFGGIIDRGEGTIGVEQPTPAAEQINPNPQPQIDPYEARIQELMATRGMTRAQAVANQAAANSQSTDYNNDGAVTDNEWRQFQQTPQGAAYMAKHPGPGGIQTQPGAYQGAQITPEQQAAIQRFRGYGRGDR